jgi:hypothetical protein
MENESIRYVRYARSEYECRVWGSGCPMAVGAIRKFFVRVLAGIKAICL